MSTPLHRLALVHGVVIALVVAAGQVEAWTVGLEGGSRAVTVAAALAATLGLASTLRHPRAAALVVVGALVAKDALDGADELVVLLACGVVTIFRVGVTQPLPRAVGTLIVLLALAAVAVVFGESAAPGELLFSALATGGPWTAGRLLRTRNERATILQELVERREREAADTARVAAMTERARIARELHDHIGHSVSLMVLQAGAAEQVVRERPEQAASSLASIQSTGREAIEELRQVLGLLRDPESPADRDPLPELRDLGGLVDRVRAAGVDVTLDVKGPEVDLPPGVDLAAFRIVQEALTNVVKHAGEARARVVVAYEPDRLRLEVADDGRAAVDGASTGQGLVGICERAALYGGRAEAGPVDGGGFRVVAELPIGAAAS